MNHTSPLFISQVSSTGHGSSLPNRFPNLLLSRLKPRPITLPRTAPNLLEIIPTSQLGRRMPSGFDKKYVAYDSSVAVVDMNPNTRLVYFTRLIKRGSRWECESDKLGQVEVAEK